MLVWNKLENDIESMRIQNTKCKFIEWINQSMYVLFLEIFIICSTFFNVLTMCQPTLCVPSYPTSCQCQFQQSLSKHFLSFFRRYIHIYIIMYENYSKINHGNCLEIQTNWLLPFENWRRIFSFTHNLFSKIEIIHSFISPTDLNPIIVNLNRKSHNRFQFTSHI